MAPDNSPIRHTDQEVALVLRRAVEIWHCARCWFTPDVFQEAFADIQRRHRSLPASFLGPAPVVKRVHAVTGYVQAGEVRALIQIVENQVSASGTVTEALGIIRWTSVPASNGLAPVTQVTVAPTDHEAHIQVTQQHPPKTRTIIQVLPTAWGAILGVPLAAGLGLGLLPGLAIGAATAAVGFGLGRLVWGLTAARSRARVEILSTDLTEAARDLVDVKDSDR